MVETRLSPVVLFFACLLWGSGCDALQSKSEAQSDDDTSSKSAAEDGSSKKKQKKKDEGDNDEDGEQKGAQGSASVTNVATAAPSAAKADPLAAPLAELFAGGAAGSTTFVKTVRVAAGGMPIPWKLRCPEGWTGNPDLEGMMVLTLKGTKCCDAIVLFSDQAGGMASVKHILDHGMFRGSKVDWGEPVSAKLAAKNFEVKLYAAKGSFGGDPTDFWLARFKDPKLRGAFLAAMVKTSAPESTRAQLRDAVRSLTDT